MHSFKDVNKLQFFKLLVIIVILSPSHLIAQQINTKGKFSKFIENHVSILGGLSLTKQDIRTGDFHSNFNYEVADLQDNSYKPGYLLGLRVDANESSLNRFDFSLYYNCLQTGVNYIDQQSLQPFLGSFTPFKADVQFSLLQFNSHYKRLVKANHPNTKKLYFIIGPSVDFRLSEPSQTNQISNIYHRALLKGDIGLEFENNAAFTLFVHYKFPLSSYTTEPIYSKFQSIEIGTAFKVSNFYK